MKLTVISGLLLLAGMLIGFYCALVTGLPRYLQALKRHYIASEFDRYGRLARKAVKQVTCPESALVIVVLGQSNAANTFGQRYAGRLGVYNIYQGACYPASDPLLGAQGNQGSLWVRFANQIPGPVALVPFTIGSTRIQQWTREFRADLLAELRLLKKADIIIWQQGESDNGVTSEDSYRQNLEELSAMVHEVFPDARFITAVSSYCHERSDAAIRRAQMTAKGVEIGPDTDDLYSFEDRIDGCHFSAEGQKKAADLWARTIARSH
jgi:hypothetical protein